MFRLIQLCKSVCRVASLGRALGWEQRPETGALLTLAQGVSGEPAYGAFTLREQGFAFVIKGSASHNEAIREEVLFLLQDF